MSYKLESDVIKALGKLLKTETNYDVIIHIGEKPDFKEFHTHSTILCCRSDHFDSILSAKDVEKKDGKYVIKKPNITPQVFDIIINYLYTGHINFNNKTGTVLLAIMITSNELKLQLPKLTEDFNIENHHQFLQNDLNSQIIDFMKKKLLKQLFFLQIAYLFLFLIIQSYLYTGQINFTNKTGNELLDIMIASDKLNLRQLIKLAEEFIIQNHQKFLQNDSIGILQIVYYHQTFNNLREFCLETICYEPEILFNSAKFINLSAPLLEVILKRDDLNLVEVEVWENLIKWGLAQVETLNKDVSKWHQDEFNAFERILHKFIPLIRFHEISSDDYVNKVRPYEENFSEELRNDIYKFHMISGYKPTLNKYSPRCPKYLIDLKLKQVFKSTFQQSEFFQKALTEKDPRMHKQLVTDQICNTLLAERHLYLAVKIVTAEIFKNHQVRFWVFANRCNKTVRLDVPIPESDANTSMKKICARMTPKQNELRLYMEVAYKPFNDKSWFLPVGESNHVIVFLKYFDPDTQTLEGLGHLYVQLSGKLGDYTRVLCEKKNFPLDTPLKIYEEIKPNMIDELKLKVTFRRLEIQNGDIICFQKALTEREIQVHIAAGRVHNIPQFYDVIKAKIETRICNAS